MTAPELWKEFYDANFYKYFAGHSFARADFGREFFEAGILAGQAPDTITLPRAEVEALMEAVDALDDEYCSQQYGPSLHAIDKMRMALLALQERMK